MWNCVATIMTTGTLMYALVHMHVPLKTCFIGENSLVSYQQTTLNQYTDLHSTV